MLLLRGYLLLGLAAHKLIWVVLEQRNPPESDADKLARPLRVRLIKAVKVVILLGVAAQTVMPDILPIASDATRLRVLGALIYTFGWCIAVLGRIQLGSNWANIETATVLAEQRVVSRGVYRFIRHPIYVGDLLLLIGLELACNSWLVLGALALTPVVMVQAVREEKLMRDRLPGYADYCQTTKRFVPFVV